MTADHQKSHFTSFLIDPFIDHSSTIFPWKSRGLGAAGLRGCGAAAVSQAGSGPALTGSLRGRAGLMGPFAQRAPKRLSALRPNYKGNKWGHYRVVTVISFYCRTLEGKRSFCLPRMKMRLFQLNYEYCNIQPSLLPPGGQTQYHKPLEINNTWE